MQVTCAHCQRSFELNPQRAANLRTALCTCGESISLHEQRLGKYQLTRRIAVGGMGEIFHGKIGGIEGFEREVAIKKLLPHLTADRNFIDMMVKEAKLTVLLNHPSIVQVYDLAKEGREYYIAMEYVDGINVGTLLELTRRRRQLLPVDVVLHIVLHVLRGLHYAHGLRSADGQKMGILHRDITPQNILITRAGFVKITDFGIAKARNEISTTRPGMIKGKLGYIAPEQLTDAPLDHRVDLFCAGILLWEALACRRLFKGETEIDSFRLVARAQVPTLDDVRDDISPQLFSVIQRSLAKNPCERFASGNEFYEAISNAIFPQTPDDCSATTVRYFENNSFLFVREEETPIEERTMELGAQDVPIEITSLLDVPAKSTKPEKSSRALSLFLLGIFLFSVSGAAVWVFLQSGRASVSEPSVSPHVSSMVSEEEASLLVKASLNELRAICFRKYTRELRKLTALQATIVFAANGAVAEVHLQPSLSTAAEACITNHLRKIQLRALGRPKLQIVVILPLPAVVPQPPIKNGGTTQSPSSTSKLTVKEITNVVQRSKSITTCLHKIDAGAGVNQVKARIVINTQGRVKEVSGALSIKSAADKACLFKALRRLRFRRQPQPNFAVTIPFELERLR